MIVFKLIPQINFLTINWNYSLVLIQIIRFITILNFVILVLIQATPEVPTVIAYHSLKRVYIVKGLILLTF